MGNPEDPDVIRSRQIDADNAWAKAHIEKAENWLDDQADKQRALIPPNDHVGLLMHDGTVGIVKTAYHLAKGLLGLAMDVGRLKDDPVYRENVAQKVWNGAVWLAKEAWISQGHEGPQAIQDQNERVIAFSKGLWDKAKKGWEEAGTKPGHQTQLVVEIAATIATFFVGGEAAAAGDAEKLDEGAAILDEVTQPCIKLTDEEILAEQAAKEAAEAEKVAEAGEAAKPPAVPPEVTAAEAAAKAARNNPDAIALGLSTVKEPVTLPNGQVIVGSRDGVLQKFASGVETASGEKAATWTKFDPTVDPESGLRDWGPTIKNAMNDAKEIHFNLEGMNDPPWSEIVKNPDVTRFKPPSTNWELSNILSDPELLKKTKFYDGAGNPVKILPSGT
jgi:hypothetical protein